MSANANALPDATATSTTAPLRTRPFFWSVKRELWENRSLYIAPLAVATLLLLAVVVSYVQGRGITISIPEATQVESRSVPCGLARCICGVRGNHDRHDVLRVLVLPARFLAWRAQGSQRAVLEVASGIRYDDGAEQARHWRRHCSVDRSGHRFRSLSWSCCLARLRCSRARPVSARKCSPMPKSWSFRWSPLYLLIVGAAWYAPISGWLLFVSSWARRTPFLWAVLPPAAISIAEYLAFGTSYFRNALDDRFGAGLAHAFDPGSGIQVSETGRHQCVSGQYP